LLAAENPDAADLADGFLRAMATGKQAHFDDDRLFAHRPGNLIEAYLDWSAVRAAQREAPLRSSVNHLTEAGLLVHRAAGGHTVVSSARGGVFKHFAPGDVAVTDAGLIVETADGRVAVSQLHHHGRETEGTVEDVDEREPAEHACFSVAGSMHWSRFETATPVKQAVFHLGMSVVGRWCRTLVRRLLQGRLIVGRRRCPIRLTRSFEWPPLGTTDNGPTLRVTDVIELTHPGVRVRRMSFGSDHQAAYVAATNVYQDSVLDGWTDLEQHVARLNAQRRVCIVREF